MKGSPSLTLPLDRRSGAPSSIITAGCFLRATAGTAAVAGVALTLEESPKGGGTVAATGGSSEARPLQPVASRKRPRPGVGRPASLRHKTNGQQAAGHKGNAITNQLQQDHMPNLRGENQLFAQNNDLANLRGEVSNELKSTHGGSIFSAASLSGLIYQGYIYPSKRDDGADDAAGRHISTNPSRGRLEQIDPSATVQIEDTIVPCLLYTSDAADE